MSGALENVLAVVGVIVFLAVGTVVVVRLASSPSDRAVSRTERGAAGARRGVAAAADRHGWHVRTGEQAARPFPADLAMTYATPRSCDQVVEGRRPVRFTAETWTLARRNAGSAVAVPVRHHFTHVPWTRPGAVPAGTRFAVGRARLLGFAAVNLPDDLVGHEGRRLGEARVWGEDGGLADRLVPVLPALVAGEVWVVVADDRVVLGREGELGEEGLVARVELAAQVAEALSSPRTSPA